MTKNKANHQPPALLRAYQRIEFQSCASTSHELPPVRFPTFTRKTRTYEASHIRPAQPLLIDLTYLRITLEVVGRGISRRIGKSFEERDIVVLFAPSSIFFIFIISSSFFPYLLRSYFGYFRLPSQKLSYHLLRSYNAPLSFFFFVGLYTSTLLLSPKLRDSPFLPPPCEAVHISATGSNIVV